MDVREEKLTYPCQMKKARNFKEQKAFSSVAALFHMAGHEGQHIVDYMSESHTSEQSAWGWNSRNDSYPSLISSFRDRFFISNTDSFRTDSFPGQKISSTDSFPGQKTYSVKIRKISKINEMGSTKKTSHYHQKPVHLQP